MAHEISRSPGPTALSTQAVRKVRTETAQAGSAFQLRQFLESRTENAHSLNLTRKYSTVCFPTTKHTQIQTCVHMFPSHTKSRQTKNMTKHCCQRVVWGRRQLPPLVSCAPQMDQDGRKLGLSVCEHPHNVPVRQH